VGEQDLELGEQDLELGEQDLELGEQDLELGEQDFELGEQRDFHGLGNVAHPDTAGPPHGATQPNRG